MRKASRWAVALFGFAVLSSFWWSCATGEELVHSGVGGSTALGGAAGAGGATDVGGAAGAPAGGAAGAPAGGAAGTTDVGGAPGEGGAAGAPAGGAAGAPAGGAAGAPSAGGAAGAPSAGGAAGAPSAGGAAGAPSAGGAAGAPGAGGANAYDYTPPFVVDDTSYATTTADSVWGNSGTVVTAACAPRAPAGAPANPAGACHKITYTWSATTGTNCAGTDAGVGCAWTAVTWKSIPSKKIGPGATKIQFYAWGNGKVTFKEPTATATHDLAVTLTATPTKYTVDLTGLAYNVLPQEVAFIVVFVSADTGTVVNIDDLRWL
jgi:hypothetical protein